MTAIQLMLLTGEWLLYLLAFILAVRPLVKLDKRLNSLFKYRKQMGWAFGGLTLLHVGIYVFAYLDDISFILTLLDDLWFVTGLIATILTLALTATSNRWSQRKLKQNWKILHKATYYIGFLGIVHGELASKQVNYGLYFLLTVYALMVLYRYRNSFGIGVVIISVFIAYQAVAPAYLMTTQEVMTIESDNTIAFDRCGQFGLTYYEVANGFWDCRKATNDQ